MTLVWGPTSARYQFGSDTIAEVSGTTALNEGELRAVVHQIKSQLSQYTREYLAPMSFPERVDAMIKRRIALHDIKHSTAPEMQWLSFDRIGDSWHLRQREEEE